MLDRKFIRQESETVRRAIADKRESADLDAFLDLDRRHLELIREVEELQAERNRASKEIGRYRKEGLDAQEMMDKVRDLGREIAALDERRAQGLLRRRLTLESPQGPLVRIGGREYLNFCSNDYLGLANDADVVAAFQRGLATWGYNGMREHELGIRRGYAMLTLDNLDEKLFDAVPAAR